LERGTHHELVRRGGVYAGLARAQQPEPEVVWREDVPAA